MITTIGFKALVGGVKALKSGEIITTPYVDYFMFNNNKKKNGMSLYSTTEIMRHALTLSGDINKINQLFQVEGMPSKYSMGNAARNNLNAAIHVSILRRGLPAKAQ